MDTPVDLRVADSVATVTLNRPEKRNALNDQLLDALLDKLTLAKEDPAAHCIVLTGAGEKAFCAGGDLGSMPQGLLQMHQGRERFVDTLKCMSTLGKPILARVAGDALGGGFGLMLACDLVIAADDTQMGTPEVQVGLFPMMIMALIFRNIGRKKGMELMLSGAKVGAPEAQTLGLINYAVPREQLDSKVAELASKIAGFSPAVLKLGRDAFYHSADMDQWSALEYLRSQLTLNTLTEDAAEGIMAFLSKRKPEWKGR